MKHRLALFLLALFPIVSHSQISTEYNFLSLTDSIQSILDSTKAPGAQVAIFSNDSILWTGNFGFADNKTGLEVKDETFFRIGSVTKTFVAVAALQLIESGRLNLDDKITDLVPDVFIQNKFNDTHPITIAHLLEHTAGFDDMHLKEYAADAEGWTLEEGINYHPHNKKARWKPGTQMSYCNSGPPLVAHVIEKITGQPFEEYVRQHIFDPLGMTYSSFVRTPEVIDRLAKGYGNSGEEEMPYWHISQRPAGSINSNVTEMASFVQMLLNNGIKDSVSVLMPKSVKRMENCETTMSGKAGYSDGYGLHNYVVNFKGMKWHGHDGGMMGFLAKASYNRENDIGFVTLVNATNGAIGQINRAIYAFIHNSLDKDIIPSPIVLSEESTKNLRGFYKVSTSRNGKFKIVEHLSGITKVGIDKDGWFVRDQLTKTKTRAIPIAQNALMLESKRNYRSPMIFTESNGVKYAQQTNWFVNFKKTSVIKAFTPIIIAGSTLLMAVLLSIWGLIWMPLKGFKVFKKGKWSLRYLPLLSLAGLGLLIYFFNRANEGNVLEKLGQISVDSMGMFLSSILMGLGMLLFCWSRIRARVEEETTWFRWVSFITSLLFIISFIYLFKEGLVGLRTWAY